MLLRDSATIYKGRQKSEWYTSVVYLQSILGIAQIIQTGGNSAIPGLGDLYYGMPILTGTFSRGDPYIDRRQFNYREVQLNNLREEVIPKARTKTKSSLSRSISKQSTKGNNKRKSSQIVNEDNEKNDQYLDDNGSDYEDQGSSDDVCICWCMTLNRRRKKMKISWHSRNLLREKGRLFLNGTLNTTLSWQMKKLRR